MMAFATQLQELGQRQIQLRRIIKMFKISRMLFTGIVVFVTTITSAQDIGAQGKSGQGLVGAWELTISFKDCTTGQVLRQRPGLISFMFGGVMQEFGTGQMIPQNRTDAQGSWSHVAANTFESVSKTFRFNADGSLAGTAKLYRAIHLNQEPARLETTVDSEIYDTDGNLIARGCADEVGTRLE
jgi:hypothetical protein